MTHIVYQSGDVDATSHEVDEISQQILIYLLINGSTPVGELVDQIGAAGPDEVESRYNEILGPDAAGLVHREQANRTLDGGIASRLALTDSGSELVHEHASSMSAPADVERLASTVSHLRTEINELRERIAEVEHRLSKT